MLALEGVDAAYGMSQVLSDVALTVGAGEAVALLGRNGVGKTTLLRTIVGLHPASSGRIAFDDEQIAGSRRFGARGSASATFRKVAESFRI